MTIEILQDRKSAPRYLMDVSDISAIGYKVPNKFTRMVDFLRSAFPDLAMVQIGQSGFAECPFASPPFDEPRLDLETLPKLASSPHQGEWWTRHVKLRLLAMAARLRTPAKLSVVLNHVGAYSFFKSFDYLSAADRRSYTKRFGIVANKKLKHSFDWWMRSKRASLYDGPDQIRFEQKASVVSCRQDDIVFFCAPLASIAPIVEMTMLKKEQNFTLIIFLLDVAAFLSPGCLAPSAFRRYADNLEMLVGSADLILVPSASARDRLEVFLNFLGAPTANILAFRPALGLRPLPRSKSFQEEASKPAYVLMISDFKVRKNVRWIFDVWQRAEAMLGAKLPELVMVAARPNSDITDLVTIHDTLADKLRIVDRPNDRELSILISRASFMIHPPSQGGLATALMEAEAFGKTCLCEDHEQYRSLTSDFLVKVVREADLWVGAIKSLVERFPRRTESAGKLPIQALSESIAELRLLVASHVLTLNRE